MRKKLIRTMITLIAVIALFASLGLTANAASGSGSSTYYYNLQEDYRASFNIGDIIYVSNLSDIADESYIAYGFPVELKGELEIVEQGTYANGDGYAIKIITNGYWDSCNGYLIHQSANHWKYWCWGGAYQGYDVYVYTCQTGTFYPSDVTFDFDSQGNITGAKLFAGKSNEVIVPEVMLNITDNNVDYDNGDYTRSATLGGVATVVVDSNAIYNRYLKDLNLDSQDSQAIKELLINATNNADVERILAQANALAALDKDAATQIGAIENLNGDYQEEQARITEIERATNKAKEDILKATNIGDVNSLKNAAIDANALTVAKASAINEVTDAYNKQYGDIIHSSVLNATERLALQNELTFTYNNAKSKINNAQNPSAVAQEKQDALVSIDLIDKKIDAINNINSAAQSALATLTPSQKAIWGDAITEIASDAKEDVLTAALENEVSSIVSDASASIDTIVAKAKAITALEEDIVAKKKAIEALSYLSDQQKQDKYLEIDNAAIAARQAINSATNPTEVTSASTDGKNALTLIGEKADAINKVLQDIAVKTKDIKQLVGLTDQQKEDLIKALEIQKDSAVEAIDNANDSQAISAAATANLYSNKITALEAKAIEAVMKQSALTDEQRKAFIQGISDLSAEAIQAIKQADAADVGYTDTLDSILKLVEANITSEVDDAIALNFVRSYVADKDGKVYNAVNSQNADQINSGKDAWSNMTAEQKDKIDTLIAKANEGIENAAKSYEEFVSALQKFTEASANGFIKEYLTDSNGKIFKDCNKANYKQILSGKATWDALSQAERDAINAKLTSQGGKTYEQLLKTAEKLLTSPQTGDNNTSLWLLLLIISAMGITLSALLGKKKTLN